MSAFGRLLPLVGVFAIAAAVTDGSAFAYPQWQFTSGAARCNQCHYSPAGGGLITSFGRDAAGEDLATFMGNGALLHGAVSPPSWLAVGGDFRGASVANGVRDPSGTTFAIFPMQADLNLRTAFGAGVSFYVAGGLRGQVRNPGYDMPSQNYQPAGGSRFLSREHYLMWQPEVVGPYARAGRFYAPFGLRLAEHITYVRRDLGFNLLQETYNLSGGYVFERSELHLTAFAPDFVRHIGSLEKGFAGYYEYRVRNNTGAIGIQSRLAFAPGVTRFMGGLVGKLFVERAKLLLLGELDMVQLMFDSSIVGERVQMVGAGGASFLPIRGLVFTLLGERNQVDLQVSGAATTAGTFLVNWFPYAHMEIQMMGRLQWPSGADTAKTLLVQLHYFL